MVLGAIAAERLDPFGRAPVLRRPARRAGSARTRRRGRASGGRRTRSRRPTDERRVAADELLALERVEPSLELARSRATDRGERSDPEDLADDGGVLEQASSPRAASASSRAAMMPCTDSGSVRRGRSRARLDRQHPGELLGVERVAAGAASSACLQLGRQHASVEELCEQRARSPRPTAARATSVAALRLPPPQPGRRVEELRPRCADDEERDAGRPVDEVVDEVEQAVVGPVQVLEDEHGRALLGERLEEAAPGGEGLVAPSPPSRRSLRAEPDERAQVAVRPSALVLAPAISSRRRVRSSFAAASSVGVGLEDARLRLHHLAERPEADAVAVRQAAALAPRDQLRLAVDDARTARARAGSCRSPGRRRA